MRVRPVGAERERWPIDGSAAIALGPVTAGRVGDEQAIAELGQRVAADAEVCGDSGERLRPDAMVERLRVRPWVRSHISSSIRGRTAPVQS